MSLFCPTCANMLLIGAGETGAYKWACSTCPFEFPIEKQMTSRTPLPRKQVDDVMGGEDAWKNVDSTDSECGLYLAQMQKQPLPLRRYFAASAYFY